MDGRYWSFEILKFNPKMITPTGFRGLWVDLICYQYVTLTGFWMHEELMMLL
jgi:hypothetical protein